MVAIRLKELAIDFRGGGGPPATAPDGRTIPLPAGCVGDLFVAGDVFESDSSFLVSWPLLSTYFICVSKLWD